MKYQEAYLLVGIMVFMAGTSLVLYFVEPNTTGEAIGAPAQYRLMGKAPYTDLPYNGKPIEMPIGGRCHRDEGDQVIYSTATWADVGRFFDGCYLADDGSYYTYNYYCVGNDKLSQVWLRISPGCK